MKNFFSFLSLLICFELIVSPMLGANADFLISIARAEDCPAGTQMDSVLNRCITSEQTAAVMNAVSNCNGDIACYKTNAEQELKDAEADGKVKAAVGNAAGLINSSMKIVSIVGPLTIAIKMMATKTGTCPATSAIIMTGASLVAFGGDMMANKAHKKRLADIQKEWDAIVSGTTSTSTTDSSTTTTSTTSTDTTTSGASKVKATEGQSQAFEMLAKSEDSMAKAAKTKAGIYGVVGAAYAAAAVIAGLEMIHGSMMKCKTGMTNENQGFSIQESYALKEIQQTNDLAAIVAIQQNSNKYSSASIDSYEENKKLFSGLNLGDEIVTSIKKTALIVYYNILPIQEAHAIPGIGDILEAPVTRMVMGGVLAGWSIMMMMHASKQASVSKKRAEFLRKMKDEFNDATGAISCTSTQRADPSSPNCYCYTEAGQRNSDRSSSAVCTQLFTGKALSTTGSYLTSTSTSCITSSGAEDSSCACKSSNTCAKVGTLGSLSGLDTGTFSLTNGALSDLNGLSTGATDAANINTGASAANAVKLLNAANKVASKTKAGADAVKNKSKLANEQIKGLQTQAAAAGLNNMASNSSPLPTNASQAVAALQQELEKSKAGITSANGGQTLAGPANSGPAEPALDFNLDNNSTGDTSTQVAEAMKQDLDYGAADINKRSDENLFNVLSNRYQRSGMRRLFDTEGKTQADAPAKDDITK